MRWILVFLLYVPQILYYMLEGESALKLLASKTEL